MSIVEYRNGIVKEIKILSNNKLLQLKNIFKETLLLEEIFISPYYMNYYNKIDFLNYFKYYIEYSKKKGPESLLESLKFKTQINRLIQNYLSSYRYYVDNSINKINDTYGEDSIFKSKFNEYIKYEYERHFAYRFLYKLRNYSFHYSEPVSIIDLNIKEINHGIYIPKLILYKEDLLKFKKWGQIKTEIDELPEKIDIVKYIDELGTSINSIYKKMLNVIIENKKGKIEILLRAYNYAKEKVSHDYIALISKDKNNFNIQYFPMTFIKEIEKMNKTI